MGVEWIRINIKALREIMADQGAEGIFSPYLRRQRINAALPYIKGKVLDVGCGTGILANHVAAHDYVGVDIDEPSLESAQSEYPQYKFLSELPPLSEKFDTIIALAVIEHVENPELFLKELSIRLFDSKEGRIILTTPNPLFEWIHAMGSNLGIFSKHAKEEHKALLNRNNIISISKQCDLLLIKYNHFLFFANQLIVLKKSDHLLKANEL
jgi:2-polyprenyl-3-methyl-5-hydroxy-6-metoxy-1,4-benzoquinol methylase